MSAPSIRPFHVRLLALLIAATPLPLAAGPVEERVEEIRSRYQAIEDAKLRSEKVEFEAQDQPLFGHRTSYYEGGELVKLHLFHALGDHWSSNEYFYYDSGELFFVFASSHAWRFSGEVRPDGEGGTIDLVVEDRLYLDGGKVVRHLRKQASAKDAADLAALLREARNSPAKDSERADELLRHARGARGEMTPDDWARLLVGTE